MYQTETLGARPTAMCLVEHTQNGGTPSCIVCI